MPPAVPLIAVAVAYAASTEAAVVIGATILGSTLLASAAAGLVGFVVAAGINAVGSRAFSSKPKAPDFSESAQGRSTMVQSTIESHKIIYGLTKVSGPIVYISTTDSGPDINGATVTGTNIFLHMAIALAGHEVNAINEVILGNSAVPLDVNGWATTAPYTNLVRVKKFTGSPDQEASPDMMAEIPGWDSTHRLQGIAYLYVRLQYDPNVFAQGIPNVSAIVEGKKVYDARTMTTAWSANPAVCIRDYLTSDYGFNCSDDEINDDYFIAAANICDEVLALSSGDLQNRYRCHGVLDTATAPIDNLNALVASMAGAVTYVQGKFRAHAGSYDAPSGDITTDMLAGSVKIRTRTARQQLFNAVQGTYVDPTLNYQPTDFPPVANPTYAAQDGGQTLLKDIQLPLTNHPEAAQRIAKVILEQGRQGIQLELTLNHSALPYCVWDTVTYTDPVHGWDHKVFRIKKFTTPGIGPITLSLQEESSASYDWDAGEATTVDAAPDTNLPDPLLVSPPRGLDVAEATYVTRDGTIVKALATMTWVASQDAFLSQYQPEYKPHGEVSWQILPRTTDIMAQILDISPDAYDFRVAAINSLGIYSAYSTTSRQISGLLAPPTTPQNMTINSIGGLALIRWDEVPDNDVRIGGKIVFRHSPDTSASWAGSTSIGDAFPGATAIAILPLKPGAYFAKSVDSSGIESMTAASVTTDQATALAYANVTSLTDDPTFTGTKTNCVVSGSDLTMTGNQLFDDIPDLDALPDLDAFGGISPTATYDFATVMDLGSVQAVRLTSHLLAEVVNIRDKIDDRTDMIDDWVDFDGSDAAEADAVVYVRTTPDDPAVTPTWGVYNRLDSGEFNARAFQFRLEMMSNDPAYNILVEELSVTADKVS
jgi:Putative phage tail protein